MTFHPLTPESPRQSWRITEPVCAINVTSSETVCPPATKPVFFVCHMIPPISGFPLRRYNSTAIVSYSNNSKGLLVPQLCSNATREQ